MTRNNRLLTNKSGEPSRGRLQCYGPENSLSVLVGDAPRARISSPSVMEADQERRTMNFVNEWLDETGMNKQSSVS